MGERLLASQYRKSITDEHVLKKATDVVITVQTKLKPAVRYAEAVGFICMPSMSNSSKAKSCIQHDKAEGLAKRN